MGSGGGCRTGIARLCTTVLIKLPPQRIDLRLEVLLARKESILKQKLVLKVGERPHDPGQVGGDPLRQAGDALLGGARCRSVGLIRHLAKRRRQATCRRHVHPWSTVRR